MTVTPDAVTSSPHPGAARSSRKDFCSWIMPMAQCCLTLVDSDKQRIVDSAFDTSAIVFISAASRSLEVLSRGIAMAERDAASCGSVHASSPPGGVRQHCPSATTSGTRECANARPRAPLMCTAQPSRQGGLGANNRRGGAPRGERSRWNAKRLASACGRTSFARRRVPLHPSAFRRSASSWSRRQTTGRERKPRRAHASRER